MKMIWKLRYALHMKGCVPGIPWRECWYLAGASLETQKDEPESLQLGPTESADEEISYMAQDLG